MTISACIETPHQSHSPLVQDCSDQRIATVVQQFLNSMIKSIELDIQIGFLNEDLEQLSLRVTQLSSSVNDDASMYQQLQREHPLASTLATAKAQQQHLLSTIESLKTRTLINPTQAGVDNEDIFLQSRGIICYLRKDLITALSFLEKPGVSDTVKEHLQAIAQIPEGHLANFNSHNQIVPTASELSLPAENLNAALPSTNRLFCFLKQICTTTSQASQAAVASVKGHSIENFSMRLIHLFGSCQEEIGAVHQGIRRILEQLEMKNITPEAISDADAQIKQSMIPKTLKKLHHLHAVFTEGLRGMDGLLATYHQNEALQNAKVSLNRLCDQTQAIIKDFASKGMTYEVLSTGEDFDMINDDE